MKTVSIRGGFFLLLGFLAIILPTAPISSIPTMIETPDYLICLIFAWLVCDPKSSPFLSILFLSVLADILWQRPLGLSPIFILLLTEIIRHFHLRFLYQSILFKWFYFFGFLILLNLGTSLLSIIAALTPLDFKVWFNRFLFTIFVFPIINILLEYTVFNQHWKIKKR